VVVWHGARGSARRRVRPLPVQLRASTRGGDQVAGSVLPTSAAAVAGGAVRPAGGAATCGGGAARALNHRRHEHRYHSVRCAHIGDSGDGHARETDPVGLPGPDVLRAFVQRGMKPCVSGMRLKGCVAGCVRVSFYLKS
jgi:hypothetical protein